ncbi:MAG: hypothetical protein ACYTHN_21255, partial [Planctomycetota bacterium]
PITMPPPAPPPSITVPSSSANGVFTVTWQASTSGMAYDLQEDVSATFSNPTWYYFYQPGCIIGGRSAGTYYYRVRSVGSGGNSTWTAGANGCTVSGTATTPVPPTPQVSASGLPAGAVDVSYGTTSGTTPYLASVYDIDEDTSPNFSNATRVYSGPGGPFFLLRLSPMSNGTYYYRVRAGNAGGFTPWVTASCTVGTGGVPPVPPPIPLPPASITVPAVSNTGNYTLLWQTSAQATAYTLEEDLTPNFPSPQAIYTGSVPSYAVTGKGNGTYYYRVCASNASGSSAWTAGANGVTVTLPNPPPAPASITVPPSSTTGTFTLTWASSNGATSYNLEESNSPAFTSPVPLPSTQSTSYSISGKPSGVYYYRVRALGLGGLSPWTAGANGCQVQLQGTLTLALGPNPGGPVQELAGETDVPVLSLLLTADAVENITATGLTVSVTGTLDDSLGGTAAKLIVDANGDGLYQANSELSIAGPLPFTQDDGTVTFSGLSRTLPAGSSENWLVLIDLPPAAPVGSTFRLWIANNADLPVTGSLTASPIVTGAPLWSVEKRIGILGSLHASAGLGNPPSAVVVPGATGVEMLHLSLAAGSPEPVRIESLLLRVNGISELPGFLSISIVGDSNGNGALDPTDILISGPQPVLSWDGIVCFYGLNEVIMANSRVHWFLTADFTAQAPGGATVSVSLEDPGELTAEGCTHGEPITPTGLPVTGNVMTVAIPAVAPAEPSGGCAGSNGSPSTPAGLLGWILLAFLCVTARRIQHGVFGGIRR